MFPQGLISNLWYGVGGIAWWTIMLWNL